jgi:hypothetical protein
MSDKNSPEPPWVPVFRVGDEGPMFGISGSEWVAARGDGTLATLHTAPHAFLSLLEVAKETIDALARRAIDERSITVELLPEFPHAGVVMAGLKASSDYWQDLALTRVASISDKTPFRAELLQLALNGATQGIRHRARKLART